MRSRQASFQFRFVFPMNMCVHKHKYIGQDTPTPNDVHYRRERKIRINSCACKGTSILRSANLDLKSNIGGIGFSLPCFTFNEHIQSRRRHFIREASTVFDLSDFVYINVTGSFV